MSKAPKYGSLLSLVHSCQAKLTIILLFNIQVATALLVAGSTLTFWIPWQTSFASTSSYSSLFKVYKYNGSFQLMHTSSGQCCFSSSGFSGWAATGCRLSVAYRTLAKDQSQAVSWSFHAENSLATHSLTYAISVWPHHCCASARIHTWRHNCDRRAMAIKALISPPPRWVSAQLL